LKRYPGEGDIFDEQAYQLLPLDVSRRGGMPDGGQIMDQGQHPLLRLGAEELRGTWQHGRRVPLQPRHLRELFVPLAL